MNGSQVQIQQQTERQQLKLTPQQLLNARLVELPLVELEDRVKTELLDNIALEEGRDTSASASDDNTDDYGLSDETGINDNVDNYDTSDYGDGAESFGRSDEEIPVYTSRTNRSDEDDRPIGDTKSFIDYLYSQIGDFDVTDAQRQIIEVLIGSLDANGFIDRTVSGISDDLLFKFDIDASTADIETAIGVLQKFEPAGIGARNLQECLIIQLDRQLADNPSVHVAPHHSAIVDNHSALVDNPSDSVNNTLHLAKRIVTECFNDFKRQDTATVASKLGVSQDDVKSAFERISRLNPRPGLALSEAADSGYQAIVPDFIIETSPDGAVNIELNHGEVPELRVSPDYADRLKQYQKAGNKMGRAQMEAFEYTRMKVEGARMFIESVKQRQRTLMQTMRAIARLQHDFIVTQDESQLHIMRLADVAELAHIDVSTVSRVRKDKYALLDGVLYPLDFFFLRSRTNADGDLVQHREAKQALQELVDSEDKNHPYTDQMLESLLRQRGHNISRRTVAKYRNEMGIPTAQARQ